MVTAIKNADRVDSVTPNNLIEFNVNVHWALRS